MNSLLLSNEFRKAFEKVKEFIYLGGMISKKEVQNGLLHHESMMFAYIEGF